MNETQTADRPMILDMEEPAAQALAPRAEPQPRRAQVVHQIEDAAKKALERAIVKSSVDKDGNPLLGQLFAALAQAQGQFADLERTRTARIESDRAKYSYDYETLADVIACTKDGLTANGLAVLQFPFPGASTLTLRTILGHSSGEWISNDMVVDSGSLDPRAVGSAITYLCRYARKAILGIAALYDDDAEQVIQQRPQPAQRRSQQPPPPQPEATAPAAPAAPAPAAPAKPAEPVGTIEGLETREGVTFVQLSGGYRCGTRSVEIAEALRKYRDGGRTVRVLCRPVRTAGALPVIDAVLEASV